MEFNYIIFRNYYILWFKTVSSTLKEAKIKSNTATFTSNLAENDDNKTSKVVVVKS